MFADEQAPNPFTFVSQLDETQKARSYDNSTRICGNDDVIHFEYAVDNTADAQQQQYHVKKLHVAINLFSIFLYVLVNKFAQIPKYLLPNT